MTVSWHIFSTFISFFQLNCDGNLNTACDHSYQPNYSCLLVARNLFSNTVPAFSYIYLSGSLAIGSGARPVPPLLLGCPSG